MTSLSGEWISDWSISQSGTRFFENIAKVPTSVEYASEFIASSFKEHDKDIFLYTMMAPRSLSYFLSFNVLKELRNIDADLFKKVINMVLWKLRLTSIASNPAFKAYNLINILNFFLFHCGIRHFCFLVKIRINEMKKFPIRNANEAVMLYATNHHWLIFVKATTIQEE